MTMAASCTVAYIACRQNQQIRLLKRLLFFGQNIKRVGSGQITNVWKKNKKKLKQKFWALAISEIE